MPDVRNCRKCGKIFSYIGGVPICPSCRQQEEEIFKKIKDYLYENPGASVTEVSRELDVSIELIKRFLREGRLEIVGEEGKNLLLECENCGRAINSGRYCKDCERELLKGFQTAANKISQKISDNQTGSSATKMRYLHKLDYKRREEE
ncbi:MAG TPA: MerR family transcriptional regulator [Clostridiaceae bacterium]|nr:MerR family transcriptional regulator [Clostridiaceae bacterium]